MNCWSKLWPVKDYSVFRKSFDGCFWVVVCVLGQKCNPHFPFWFGRRPMNYLISSYLPNWVQILLYAVKICLLITICNIRILLNYLNINSKFSFRKWPRFYIFNIGSIHSPYETLRWFLIKSLHISLWSFKCR